MRKIFYFLPVLLISLSLVGCNMSDNNSDNNTNENITKLSNPVRAELYFESGNKLGDVYFTYDEKGNMTAYTMKYTAENIFLDDETHNMTYDENGNILKETVNYGFACAMPFYEYTYKNNKLIKKSPGAGSYIKYVYDNSGNLSATYNVDSLGNEKLYQTVKCDKDGHVVYTLEKRNDIRTEWVYTYKNGIIQKEEYFCNGNILLSHNYDYENSLLIKQDVSLESFKKEGYLIYHYE